ncbi:MAG: phospholipase D-like domain-containing protein, partial [Gammaproteobacteria bacterium]
TKAIIIDDFYSLIGSANLDARSLRLNFEIGVEVFGQSFNGELANYFARMLARSKPANPARLDARSQAVKLRDAIAWLFSPYL